MSGTWRSGSISTTSRWRCIFLKLGNKIWLCVSRSTRAYHKTDRVYSFYSRNTAFILFSCKITYFSVDIAVILILLKNIFPFLFTVIFFYLNHAALNILTIRIVRIRPRNASNDCQNYFGWQLQKEKPEVQRRKNKQCHKVT